ncbi:MAG: signal recognition particle subunit SRP19/SEC65 family protein [Candidatus Asgardarchaeia archaeon]
MKKREGYIIWPEYFNRRISRKYGRRVPLNKAVDEVNVNKLSSILRRMGTPHIVERGKRYPRLWWESDGYVVVKWEGKKGEIMKKISEELKRR